MDAVYPATASALARGRRLRRRGRGARERWHTQPVTFAEIKEVDEENEGYSEAEQRRRRRDLLEDGGAVGERRGRARGRGALPEHAHSLELPEPERAPEGVEARRAAPPGPRRSPPHT